MLYLFSPEQAVAKKKQQNKISIPVDSTLVAICNLLEV